jgi:hypothetical protein
VPSDATSATATTTGTMAEQLLEAGVPKPSAQAALSDDTPADKRSLIFSFLALVLSIPALIGA